MNISGPVFLSKSKVLFSIWAPYAKSMTLHIVSPRRQKLPMDKNQWGYFTKEAENVQAGCRYFYIPDEKTDLPDPASHFQPEGVHGPSEVVMHESFSWDDQSWRGIKFSDLILYELHTGTFTEEGTFEAVIPRLDELLQTGINAIEIMPVAQFPGSRNWGYDGVYLYAVQNSYGGPSGLKKLVNACHRKGIAVFLDVVYNHFGPEGNYLPEFGPCFTKTHKSLWGEAVNFDDEWSDGVRDFIRNNVSFWFEQYHLDGLRLDAIHAIKDSSAIHILEELNTHTKILQQALGKPLHLIAESDLNDPRVLYSHERGGLGFDAQWLDDFHHALYVLIHPAGKERYEDFGAIEQLAKAFKDGFVSTGEYVKFRKRKYGRSSAGIAGDRFVVFNQNHDQIGNRPLGERLSVLVDFERLKVAAAVMILSPYVPMLFMGEEYAEDTPFYYFVSHSDPQLVEAVREGRKAEFSHFSGPFEPKDAQLESTFTDSKIKWQKRHEGKHAVMVQWIKKLIDLRKTNDALKNVEKHTLLAYGISEACLIVQREQQNNAKRLLCIFNMAETELTFKMPVSASNWIKLLDASDYPPGPPVVKRMPDSLEPLAELHVLPLSVSIYSTKN